MNDWDTAQLYEHEDVTVMCFSKFVNTTGSEASSIYAYRLGIAYLMKSSSSMLIAWYE